MGCEETVTDPSSDPAFQFKSKDAFLVRTHHLAGMQIDEWKMSDESWNLGVFYPDCLLWLTDGFKSLERYPYPVIPDSTMFEKELTILYPSLAEFVNVVPDPWAHIIHGKGGLEVKMLWDGERGEPEITGDWELIEIGPDGEEIRRYADGSIQVHYEDGSILKKYPDNKVELVYNNGDTITVYPDSRLTYTPAWAGGRKHITLYPDGSYEYFNAGADAIRVFKNGDTLRTHPNGETTTIKPDGTTIHLNADADIETTTLPDGTTIEEHAETGYTLTIYPGQVMEREHFEDDTVTTLIWGTIRITLDPFGNTEVVELPGADITDMDNGGKFMVLPGDNTDGDTTAVMDQDYNITITYPDGTELYVPAPE